VGPDGALIKDAREQIAQTWRNVRTVVEAAGMVGSEHVEYSRDCRNRTIEGERPGSTLVYVAGLAEPEMIIEIDVIAAA
jgi:enamine deaminase RidA (YjgF/YER057c/UK114 family)